MQTYAGSFNEKSFMVSAKINGIKEDKIDFLVSNNAQKMPVCHYSIPQHWIKKYNLPANPCSASGLNRITIGKDQGGLFPVLLDHFNGVVVSRSNIKLHSQWASSFYYRQDNDGE